MEYNINDVCINLSVGKSTVYDRIKEMKKNIPMENWKDNDYFYYNSKNKLTLKEKGYVFIRDYNTNIKENHDERNGRNEICNVYQNQIIEIYKERIHHLEEENKRLLEIIAFKEKKELARDVEKLETGNKNSLFYKFFNRLKKQE